MGWAPPSCSSCNAQHTHAHTPSRIGAPHRPGRHRTPPNLSTPDRANPALWCSWSAARMFTQNVPASRIRGHVDDVRDGAKLTSGGSSDSDVNDWQVNPIGPD